VHTVNLVAQSESPVKILDGGVVKGIPLVGVSPGKILVDGKVMSIGCNEIFVDYVHPIAFLVGYPQIQQQPPGTNHNQHLWITGKCFKNLVDSVVIGGLTCTDLTYADTVTLPDLSAGCAVQCILPSGLANGSYDVNVTIDGTLYTPEYEGNPIQFNVEQAADVWLWTCPLSNDISGVDYNTGDTWDYLYDFSNRLIFVGLQTGDAWYLTW